MNQNEQMLIMMRGMVASMEPAEQTEVQEAIVSFRNLADEVGDVASIAMGIVALENAIKEEKS